MSKINFSVDGRRLCVENKRIDLPYVICEALECGDQIVVRIEPPVGEIFNRNIFCFSKYGELIWQIQECPHGTEEDKPYVGLVCGDRGEIVAANWKGIDYSVNINNGAVVPRSFRR